MAEEKVFDRGEIGIKGGDGPRAVDLLIIGGGITGSRHLLDATARGMKAALVEMQDFAAGTSNRSTKLVHGGLRYLKQFEVGLVAEVGKERAIVYENGPHITTPVWMLLPIIEGGTYGWWRRASASICTTSSRASSDPNGARCSAQSPRARGGAFLSKEGLKGAGYYVEYLTDEPASRWRS